MAVIANGGFWFIHESKIQNHSHSMEVIAGNILLMNY